MQQSRYISIRNMTITLIIMMSIFPFGFMLYSLTMERTLRVNEAIQESAIQNEQNAKLIIQTAENSELMLTMLSRLPIVQAGDEQAANRYLLDLVSRYPQYSSLFIVDKSGQRWATTNQMSGAVSYSDRKYFANAISSGNFSSGEYAIGKIKKKPVFSFGQPVMNSSGEITGVAVATIELSGLKSLLQKHSIVDNKSVIVTDHAGKILLHTAHMELEGKQEEYAVFRRMLQGPDEATMEAEGRQSTSRIIAYKKLYLTGEKSPYMYVLLESDKAQLLKETNRRFGTKLSILLATMFSSLFLAYLFSKRFVLNKAEEGELLHQALFSRAGDGILIMSSEGKLIKVNESFALMHGYSLEEMLQLGLKVLDTPETARLIPERMAKVLAGESLTFEVEHYHKDGHIIPLEVSASVISANEELYIQCFHRNITERKQAENALKASNKKYQSLYNDTPVMLHSIDTNGYLINVSDYWLNALGYSRDEVIGRKSTEFLTESSRNYAIEKVLPAFHKSGYCNNIEYQFVKKNGEVIDTLLTAISERDENGITLYSLAVVTDITERNRAEITIREITERFSIAFNAAPIMMSISNINDGTYLDVNRKYLEISGFDRDEVIGKSSVEIGWISEKDRNQLKEILLQEGSVNRLELNLKAKSGQLVLCKLWGEIITIAGKTCLLSIALDITEQNRLEKQLQQAQKLESLGVLAGGIAHDFNNLLTIIIGHCSLAKKRTDKASNSLQSIETAAQRAAKLCQQMLAYAGKSNYIQSDIHLDELVNEMATIAKSSISKNVQLKSDIASDIPSVTADASQIGQVVMNLIINASEAIGDSQGEVRVYLAKRAVKAAQQTYDYLGNIIPPGWYACLEVTDNGCGMDEEIQRRIFEPFYTTKFTGRGLGMSATLGIINKHNGALQLFSKPGMGSTFKVYLPIQNGENDICESPQHDAPIPWKGKGTVLLVEDEEDVLVIAEMMLEELGFTVMKALNGREGMEMFQNHVADISLVITDIGMPIMDGYTLFRELKQLKPDLPIIISSGFGDKDITARIPREEMSGLVSKPYNLGQLEETLKNVFN